jgi:hypothetical protein
VASHERTHTGVPSASRRDHEPRLHRRPEEGRRDRGRAAHVDVTVGPEGDRRDARVGPERRHRHRHHDVRDHHARVGPRHADVDGARVDGTRIDGARIDGARIDGARIDGADIDGARVGKASRVPELAPRLHRLERLGRDVRPDAASVDARLVARLAALHLAATARGQEDGEPQALLGEEAGPDTASHRHLPIGAQGLHVEGDPSPRVAARRDDPERERQRHLRGHLPALLARRLARGDVEHTHQGAHRDDVLGREIRVDHDDELGRCAGAAGSADAPNTAISAQQTTRRGPASPSANLIRRR